MDADLNFHWLALFQAVARHGVGVMPTLRMATTLALRGLLPQELDAR